jgi:hypothetical protein
MHQNGKDSFLQQGMKLFNDFYFPIAGRRSRLGNKGFNLIRSHWQME